MHGPGYFDVVIRALVARVAVLVVAGSVLVPLGMLASGGLLGAVVWLIVTLALLLAIVVPAGLLHSWLLWRRAQRTAAWLQRRLGLCGFIWDVCDAEAQDRGLLVYSSERRELLFVPYLEGELTDWTEREADVDRLPLERLLAVETLPARGLGEWIRYGSGPMQCLLKDGDPLLFEAHNAPRAAELLRAALWPEGGGATVHAVEPHTPLAVANSRQLLHTLALRITRLRGSPLSNAAELEAIEAGLRELLAQLDAESARSDTG